MLPDEVRARYERIRAEVGDAVTIVAATKYVSVEEMAVLAGAGIEVVGENRAQDLEAKHAVYGDTFRWHFIGHLQSRKAKTVNRICELVHSLSSESAAKRLEILRVVVDEGQPIHQRGSRDHDIEAPATEAVLTRLCHAMAALRRAWSGG